MAGRGPRASSRDEILRVFAEHVADRGYADTSLSDVATELGLSKGTIVHHFGSKEALLGEVHVAYFTRRFAETDFIDAELDDPVSRLVAHIYLLLAAHRDDRAASLACLRELVRYFEGDLTEYVRQQRVRYTRTVVAVLQDGVERGVFHTPDPAMTALHIFGMCNYAWTWYRPDGPQTVEQITKLFATDILHGLARSQDDDSDLDIVVERAIDTVLRAPGRLPVAGAGRTTTPGRAKTGRVLA
jgi:AcrR family transcriptional regulator